MPDQGAILSAVDDYADALVDDALAKAKQVSDDAYAKLKAELDAYKLTHQDNVPTPTPTPTPTPVPTTPVPSDVPSGWKLFHKFDLSKNDGWTLENGKPSNADGIDRASNVLFGQGPNKDRLVVLGTKEGNSYYTGDALARHVKIPGNHRVRCVWSCDPGVSNYLGIWPSVWERGLDGNGETDGFELFGGHITKGTRVLGGTLHMTPYGSGHPQYKVDFKPTNAELAGTHTTEWQLTKDGATWWHDGKQTKTITPTEVDAAAKAKGYTGTYATQFLNNPCYERVTLQAGGEGGTIPSNQTRVEFTVYSLEVYVPA